MFIVELTTRHGRIREQFETYAEARRRLDRFPDDAVIGLAFIFQELPDGSHRLVREDGKPLQFHREIVEDAADDLAQGEPMPLAEGDSALIDENGNLRLLERSSAEDWGDLPLLE